MFNPTCLQTKLAHLPVDIPNNGGQRVSMRILERSKSTLLQVEMMSRISNGDESGLEVVTLAAKGRSIFTTQEFPANVPILRYDGELIVGYAAVEEREALYDNDPQYLHKCFLFRFKVDGKTHAIDATNEPTSVFTKGRLVNHGIKLANCRAEHLNHEGQELIVIISERILQAGEELQYNYGESRREVLAVNPWLCN
jgi:hypothetical protein